MRGADAPPVCLNVIYARAVKNRSAVFEDLICEKRIVKKRFTCMGRAPEAHGGQGRRLPGRSAGIRLRP